MIKWTLYRTFNPESITILDSTPTFEKNLKKVYDIIDIDEQEDRDVFTLRRYRETVAEYSSYDEAIEHLTSISRNPKYTPVTKRDEDGIEHLDAVLCTSNPGEVAMYALEWERILPEWVKEA